MPRKSDAAPASSKKKSTRSLINEFMGEETASSGLEDTFQSPSTDVGVTRYSLDYTSNTLRSKSKVNKLKKSAASRAPRNKDNSDEEESDLDQEKKTRRNTTAMQEAREKSKQLQKKSVSRSQRNEDYSSEEEESDLDQENNSSEEEESDVDVENNIAAKQLQTPKRTSPRKSQLSPMPGTSKRLPNSSTNPSIKPKKSKPSKKPVTAQVKMYKQLRSLQESTNLQIQKLPFSRVIREILMNNNPRYDMRITPEALMALQESAELYLTTLFQDANRCTLHRDRKTLQPKDIQLVRYIRGPTDSGNL